MKKEAPILAVTPGEPAGIGPEITIKLMQQHPALRLLVVADADLLRATAKSLNFPVTIVEWQPGTDMLPGRLYCLSVRLPSPAVPGQPNKDHASYVLETLRQAVTQLHLGHAGALVTGPVHKAIINEAGMQFSGHTEFLAGLAGVKQVVMMLAAPGLRVALVTTHLPLRQVADAITVERLEDVIRITAGDLRQRFGIISPRLQVLGLNPHAGEGGHLGSEDGEIIAPVITRCREQGMAVTGPVPADSAFTPPRLANCDAVIAMYHDQGLPVLKHMGFGHSVNITLGLPFIRTSVDHGTALDIAGLGVADAGSFFQAARLAEELASKAARG